MEGATFSFYSVNDTKNKNAEGWILWGPGPDGRYELHLENITQAYDPATSVPNPFLIMKTYDPSNGSESRGDVYRLKQ